MSTTEPSKPTERSTSRAASANGLPSVGVLAGVAAAVMALAIYLALPPSAPTGSAPSVQATKTETAGPASRGAPAAPQTATRVATAPQPPTTGMASAPVPFPNKAAKTSMKIQEITSNSGLKAWLVEEHSVPLMALRFSFDGGSSQDPVGKDGLANFITGMMDEGAGNYDSKSFQAQMEELAMRMSFEDGKDHLYGSFETLTENRAKALELLTLAINKPRFDADAVDRVREQLLAGLVYAARDPERVASKEFMAHGFAGHPYGRPANGTAESLKSISAADLEGYRQRIFARDTLRVVMVGDVTADAARALLDQVFGGLPAKADLAAIAPTSLKPADKLKVIEMDVPQSVARFGLGAMMRKDKDFMPAFVLNHLIGGGGFASRLMEEVREKRGLAYSVYSYLQPMQRASMYAGGVATKNEEIAQSLEVIRNELKRVATDGPTQRELDNAKSNLTGSFALRFDTNAKIANQLLYFLGEGFPIDYVDKRNAEVDAVSLADVKRVAKRLFENDDLFVLVVGKPKGLASRT
jgi:zinc protease